MEKYIISALLIESLVQTIKMVFQDEKINKSILISLIVSIGFSLIYKLDMLKYVGFETDVQIVGFVFSGILFSRGSNFIHDLTDRIVKIKNKE